MTFFSCQSYRNFLYSFLHLFLLFSLLQLQGSDHSLLFLVQVTIILYSFSVEWSSYEKRK